MRRFLASSASVLFLTLFHSTLIPTARATDEPPPDPPPPHYDPPSGNYVFDEPMKMDEERADPDPTPPANDAGTSYITFYDIAGYVPNSAQATPPVGLLCRSIDGLYSGPVWW